MKPDRFVALALLCLGLGAVEGAQAATITIAGGIDFSEVNDGTVPGDTMVVTGSFEPFDPSLGTLTSASFTIFAANSAFRTISGVEPGTYASFLSGEISLVGPGDATLYQEVYPVTALGCCFEMDTDGVASNFGTGVPFEFRLSDGNTVVFHRAVTVTNGLEHFLVDSAFSVRNRFFFDLRRAEGPPPHDSVPGPGTLYAADTVTGYLRLPDASGPIAGIDLTYEYTPIPEPGTAWLVGVGLAWIGVARSPRLTGGRGRL